MSEPESAETEEQEEQSDDRSNNESGKDIEIIDSNLYGSTETYFEDLISIVGELAVSTIFHDEPLLNISPGRQDGVIDTFDEQQASSLSRSLTQAWEAFPGFSSCVNAFRQSSIYEDEIKRAMERGEIDDFEEHPQLVKEDALVKLLNRYLQISDSLNFDENAFRRAYSDFENYLTEDKIRYKAQAILSNFQCEEEKLSLREEIKVKKLEEDEIGIISPRRRRMMHDGEEIFVIEYKYNVDKFGEGAVQKARETFDDVILALRLFANKGDVDYSRIRADPISDFETNTKNVRLGMPIDFLDSDYHLSSEEGEKFHDFWTVVVGQLAEPDDNYRVALDKFQNSFQRENENDRLLDCVIALEALYLKSGEQQEMSYRLAQRGALLLSENEDEALEIKQNLKEAYNLRSRLVHGSTADTDRESVLRLHDLTRESLATFIELKNEGEEHDDIIEQLDERASVPQSSSD